MFHNSNNADQETPKLLEMQVLVRKRGMTRWNGNWRGQRKEDGKMEVM